MDHNSYRNEYKYLITPEARILLSRNLGRVMKRDCNALGPGYFIKSLYFDTLDDEALNDNLLGAPYREKFRIRCYNHDYDFIRMEKKVKFQNKGYKRAAPLTKGEVSQLLDGDYTFLKGRDDELLIEFYAKLRAAVLRPKLIAGYYREPFLYRPGNVRVTLDYDLVHSSAVRAFFADETAYHREDQGKCILEVKFDEYLPDIIRDILRGSGAMRTANSKYTTGRLITG